MKRGSLGVFSGPERAAHIAALNDSPLLNNVYSRMYASVFVTSVCSTWFSCGVCLFVDVGEMLVLNCSPAFSLILNSGWGGGTSCVIYRQPDHPISWTALGTGTPFNYMVLVTLTPSPWPCSVRRHHTEKPHRVCLRLEQMRLAYRNRSSRFTSSICKPRVILKRISVGARRRALHGKVQVTTPCGGT